MAKKVKEFPAVARKREGKYPWAEWLDGGIWELDADKDFGIKPEAMRAVAYMAAKRVGVKVKVCVDKKTGLVWMQAQDMDPVT